MKRLLWSVLVIASAISTTDAQEPTPATRPGVQQPDQNPSMANLTPEMWLYMQQLERHAAQRTHRIAARKWFGLSNTRPSASPIPVMGTYSPFWSGNDIDPHRWNGVGAPVIIVEDEELVR